MKRIPTIVALVLSVYSSIAQTDNTQLTNKDKKEQNEFTLKTNSNTSISPLAGTWMLKAVEAILPDGTRVVDSAYGKNAKGNLLVDSEGRYSLQIFNPDRPKFTSNDKSRGTSEEYASALLGISTHIGHIKVDMSNNTLHFNIDYAAFPNWNNTVQIRRFKLTSDELYYEVPARPSGGSIPVSIWKRIK